MNFKENNLDVSISKVARLSSWVIGLGRLCILFECYDFLLPWGFLLFCACIPFKIVLMFFVLRETWISNLSLWLCLEPLNKFVVICGWCPSLGLAFGPWVKQINSSKRVTQHTIKLLFPLLMILMAHCWTDGHFLAGKQDLPGSNMCMHCTCSQC